MAKQDPGNTIKTSDSLASKLMLLYYFFILIFVVVCLYILNDPGFFPIKQVVVSAPYQHVTASVLRDNIEPLTKNASFISVSFNNMEKRLLQIPWVYQVAMQRVWPAKIVITITEQDPAARWNDNAILNSSGQIFVPPDPKDIPQDLPLLQGSADQVASIWQFCQTIITDLAKTDLKLAVLSYDLVIGWTVTLTDGIVLQLGNVDVDKHWHYFVQAYSKLLKPQIANIKSIDFRYPNGFAVKYLSH